MRRARMIPLIRTGQDSIADHFHGSYLCTETAKRRLYHISKLTSLLRSGQRLNLQQYSKVTFNQRNTCALALKISKKKKKINNDLSGVHYNPETFVLYYFSIATSEPFIQRLNWLSLSVRSIQLWHYWPHTVNCTIIFQLCNEVLLILMFWILKILLLNFCAWTFSCSWIKKSYFPFFLTLINIK